MWDMFAGCDSLSRVTLGESFSFDGGGIGIAVYQGLLPMPSEDGRWVLEDDPATARTAEELRDTYDGSAALLGTWVWEAEPTTTTPGDGEAIGSEVVDQPTDGSEGTNPFQGGGAQPGMIIGVGVLVVGVIVVVVRKKHD